MSTSDDAFELGRSVRRPLPPAFADVAEMNAGELMADARSSLAEISRLEARNHAVFSQMFAVRDDDRLARTETARRFVGDWDELVAETGVLLHVGRGAAGAALHRSLDLRERLPRVFALYSMGRLTANQARAVLAMAVAIIDDRVLAEFDARMAHWLYLKTENPDTAITGPAVDEAAKKILVEIDIDAIPQVPEKKPRYGIDMRSRADGTVDLEATLSKADGIRLAALIAPVMRTVCRRDGRKIGEKQVAALMALAEGYETLGCQCGDTTCEYAARKPRTGAVSPDLKALAIIILNETDYHPTKPADTATPTATDENNEDNEDNEDEEKDDAGEGDDAPQSAESPGNADPTLFDEPCPDSADKPVPEPEPEPASAEDTLIDEPHPDDEPCPDCEPEAGDEAETADDPETEAADATDAGARETAGTAGVDAEAEATDTADIGGSAAGADDVAGSEVKTDRGGAEGASDFETDADAESTGNEGALDVDAAAAEAEAGIAGAADAGAKAADAAGTDADVSADCDRPATNHVAPETGAKSTDENSGTTAACAAPATNVNTGGPETESPSTEAAGTRSPGRPSPGTKSPGTTSPGTASPGPTSPGTASPGTTSPYAGPPSAAQPRTPAPPPPSPSSPDTSEPPTPGTPRKPGGGVVLCGDQGISGPVTAEQANDLIAACDTAIRVLGKRDPETGEIHIAGATGYTPTQYQLLVMRLTYPTCVFPGVRHEAPVSISEVRCLRSNDVAA